jgi:hypothetical protein
MIKIGSDQTGHSGVLTCVTDLPGPVTLTASDPGVTLTPSSFTVGGSVAGLAQIVGNGGAGLQAITDASAWGCAKRRNFAAGMDFRFVTGYLTSISIYQAAIIVNQQKGYHVYGANWAIDAKFADRKLAFSRGLGGGAYQGIFAKAFPYDTWQRVVFVFNDASAILYLADGSSETISHTAIGTDTLLNTLATTWCAASAHYTSFDLRNFQLYFAIPSAPEIAAYLAGGDLGATQQLKLKMQEESGLIAYDHSPNMYDFGIKPYEVGYYFIPPKMSGLQRTITGLTGNEQSITYDTGSVAPGTAVTITATRVKAGFPTGRTPDISVESDTCTVTAAVAPGLSVVGVALDEHAITLDIGGTHQLNETVFPSTATTKTVTWASSNTAVATVTAGLVRRISGGTATITVTTVDGGYTDTVAVTCVDDLTGTTPQAAKAWVVQTIKALRSTIRPNEHYDEYPKLLEGGDLPPGRSRIFALEEISADASRMVFGARMYGLRLYIGYLTQTTAKAAGQVNADIMASDIDFIKRSLEYRESWDTHIISVLCGQSVISGNDSGKGLAITVTDIEIHYLPIGV